MRKRIKKKLKSYTLEFDEDQARTMMRALELYSRMGAGQFGVLDEFFMGIEEDGETDYHVLEKARQLLKELEPLRTGLPLNAHPGIAQCDEEFRMAWDLQQVMRHRISWDCHPEGGVTVNFHEPMKTADHDLPKIKRN